MTLKFSIREIEIDGHFIVICAFKDKEILPYLRSGLDVFFNEYKKFKIREKSKKELEKGYLALSGNSSGCRR